MKILLAEDEPQLAAQLQQALIAAGYVVDWVADGIDALHAGTHETLDAVILDLGLPSIDGLSVLKAWRAADKKMPVIVLTARSNWHEKVMAIDAGADDYLTKPFHMEELISRVRGLIRRANGFTQPLLSWRTVALDTLSGRVTVAGNALYVTASELKLLTWLMHHPQEVASRTTLSEHIYAVNDDPDSNTIEVFIARLRKKLPAGMIETVRGIGYRLGIP